jgi:hypothetical protein
MPPEVAQRCLPTDLSAFGPGPGSVEGHDREVVPLQRGMLSRECPRARPAFNLWRTTIRAFSRQPFRNIERHEFLGPD